MRNLFISILLCFMAWGMASCFEDDSTLGTIDVPDIEIGELRDTIIISYVGNVLHVSPVVTTAYPESDLTYAWYVYSGTDAMDDGFRTNKIADTKELDYEVNLSTGTYTLVFEVTSTANNYSAMTTMSLTTTTSFSNGFYILKETADGNTELDLLTSDGMIEGLMENLLGTPLSGAPINVSLTYNHGYINPDDQEMATTNMVHVFAEGEFHSFRTEDMLETFNNETVKFEPTPGETFGAMIEDANGILCASSNGVYRLNTGATSGRVGIPSVTGDYSHFHYQGLSYGLMGDYVWNADEHAVYSFYSNTPYEYDLPAGFTQENLEYVASSQNFTGFSDVAWFLLEDNATGRRMLLSCDMMGVTATALDEDLHIAQGDIVAGIGRDATIIYVVDNNQIYFYDFSSGEEVEDPVSLPGLPAGETISYLSNQYVAITDFFGSIDETQSVNYLVVATQAGDSYKIYVYDNLVGGVPNAQPVQVEEGTGRVEAVRYLTLYASSINMFNYFSGGTPYPFGD